MDDLVNRSKRAAARLARGISEWLEPSTSTISVDVPSSVINTEDITILIARIGLACAAAVAAASLAVLLRDTLMPERAVRQEGTGGRGVRAPAAALLRLHSRGIRLADLSQYERTLIQSVIAPADVDVSVDDIGGLEDEKRALLERAVDPLAHPELFAGSDVLRRPGGVLLHGPPGTGKTLLAKAVARESGALFLTASPATLQSVWFGESPRLAEALFSLARKLAPTIIFIDEIDGLLGRRGDSSSTFGGGEHETTAALKTVLLQSWDGLNSGAISQAPVINSTSRDRNGLDQTSPPWVLVIAATNRPSAIDDAALRRLPCRILVPPPNAAGREAILRVHLRREQGGISSNSSSGDETASDRAEDAPPVDFQAVASITTGFTGADLAEVVREAGYAVRRDAVAEAKARRVTAAASMAETSPASASTGTGTVHNSASEAVTTRGAFTPIRVRRITTADLMTAVTRVREHS